MKNFLRLGGLSILSVQYMYIDHKDYLADFLLAQNHVSVHFGDEFSASFFAKSEGRIRQNLRNPWNRSTTRCCFSDTTTTWISAMTSWRSLSRIEVPHEEIICPDQQAE